MHGRLKSTTKDKITVFSSPDKPVSVIFTCICAFKMSIYFLPHLKGLFLYTVRTESLYHFAYNDPPQKMSPANICKLHVGEV